MSDNGFAKCQRAYDNMSAFDGKPAMLDCCECNGDVYDDNYEECDECKKTMCPACFDKLSVCRNGAKCSTCAAELENETQNKARINEQIKEFIMDENSLIIMDKFCLSKECQHVRQWQYMGHDLTSCDLVGPSLNITEIPSNCLYKIEAVAHAEIVKHQINEAKKGNRL